MQVPCVNHTINGIALQLPADDRARLESICVPVELTAGQALEPASKDPQQGLVYFLESATVSLWIETGIEHERLAVALIGQEGMVGCAWLWGSHHGQWSASVLTPGRASVTSASQLRELIAQSPALVMAISRFLWQQTQEIAQLSARVMLGDLRTRLALWLHLMQHKTGSSNLPVTHEALARMLGTRRVSITLTAGELQNEGVIGLSRGLIVIKDDQALARIAKLQAG